MLRQPGRAVRRGTGCLRGGTRPGRRGARGPGRRGRLRRRPWGRRDRRRARPRRSLRRRGRGPRPGTGRRFGHRAVVAGRALAGPQQRDRDGGHDDEEGRNAGGQGRPEAGLPVPGADGRPQPGHAGRARANSPVIPASHETGRYRLTRAVAGQSRSFAPRSPVPRTLCHEAGAAAFPNPSARYLRMRAVGSLLRRAGRRCTSRNSGISRERRVPMPGPRRSLADAPQLAPVSKRGASPLRQRFLTRFLRRTLEVR